MPKVLEWDKLLKKVSAKGDLKEDLGRSPFVKDQDKIIFSGAFRRMSRKTQVHPMAVNDHVHNRLTHSLEVANVGRSLGDLVEAKLKKKDENKFFKKDGMYELGEIVRAACLAHDIGNPPFGHAGESAIQGWAKNREETEKNKTNGVLSTGLDELFADLKSFDGNAMGFRVLTSLEYHSENGGMNLSYPTLAATIKYPWTVSDSRNTKKKFNCFNSEKESFNKIFDELGLVLGQDTVRHPLSYLVEAADDICYSMLDLEDACEMSLLSLDDFLSITNEVDRYSDCSNEVGKHKDLKPSRKTALFRGLVINKLVEEVANTFVDNYDEILSGAFGKRFDDLLSENKDALTVISKAKGMCRERVYIHPRKVEVEIGAYRCIECMMDLFFDAAEELAEVNNCNLKKLKSKLVEPNCLSRFSQLGKLDGQISKSEQVQIVHGESLKNLKALNEYLEGEAKVKLKEASFKTKRILDQSDLTESQQNLTSVATIMRCFVDYLSGMTDNYATHVSLQFRGRGEG